MDLKYKKHDIVEMRKPHPCATKSKKWEILEVSGDVKIKCCGCGHVMYMQRYDFDKRIVKVISNEGE